MILGEGEEQDELLGLQAFGEWGRDCVGELGNKFGVGSSLCFKVKDFEGCAEIDGWIWSLSLLDSSVLPSW